MAMGLFKVTVAFTLLSALQLIVPGVISSRRRVSRRRQQSPPAPISPTILSNEYKRINLYGLEGVVRNPAYPYKEYSKNQNGLYIYWTITVPSGYSIRVQFMDVDINCDYANVNYKNNTANYCAAKSVANFNSVSRKTVLEMKCEMDKQCGYFLAKYEAIPPSKPLPSFPKNVFQYKGAEYTIYYKTFVTWDNAEKHCRNEGYQLASFSDLEVNFLLIAALRGVSSTSKMWIGLRKNVTTKGDFVWRDGSSLVTTKWDKEYPNKTGDYNCTALQTNGKWQNVNCAITAVCACKKVSIKPFDKCRAPLGMQNGLIKSSLISASSTINGSSANNARLHSSNSWISANPSSWLQISMGNSSVLAHFTGIATQGDPESASYVKTFILEFSQQEDDLISYKNHFWAAQVFEGNDDSNNTRFNEINPAIIGWRLRIHSITFHTTVAMRVELYGCILNDTEKQSAPIGVQSGAVQDDQLSASTFTPGCNASYARLHVDSTHLKNAWRTDVVNLPQWLQIKLKSFYHITAIATQGGVQYNQWISKYFLTYSKNDSLFEYYEDKMDFQANSDAKTVVKNYLPKGINCTILRIQPIGWRNGWIALRVELYGYKLTVLPYEQKCSQKLQPLGTSLSGVPHSLDYVGLGSNSNSESCFDSPAEVNQFFEIKLHGVTKLSGLSARGVYSHSEAIQYKMKYSIDGTIFTAYTHNGNVQYFQGNYDYTTIIKQELPYPVYASAVTLSPVKYLQPMSLTIVLYGCIEKLHEPRCSSPMGMGSNFIPVSAFQTNANGGAIEDIRLKTNNFQPNAWFPTFPIDGNNWFQVDFGTPSNLTAIATMGSNSFWVVCYKLGYFMENPSIITWYRLPEQASNLDFKGNLNSNEMTKHYLEPAIFARYIRIGLSRSHSKFALKVEFYGCGNSYGALYKGDTKCNVSIGLQDGSFFSHSFNASTTKEPLHFSGKYLGLSHRPMFWMPMYQDNHQWVEISLDEPYNITGIITEGNYPKLDFITTYMISYSMGGGEVHPRLKPDGTPTIFHGNKLAVRTARTSIIPLITADIIRLIPLTWHNNIALRMDLIGCKLSNHSTDGCEKQLEIGKANGTRVEVSSFFKLSFYPWRGRLHWIHDLEPYWSPSPTDAEPWLEIDFGRLANLTGVATQGDDSSDKPAFVKSYMLGFAVNSTSFEKYVENVKPRVFFANNDNSRVVRHYFNRNVTARYARLYPLTWNNYIALRMEFYGCKHEQVKWITPAHQAVRVGCFEHSALSSFLGKKVDVINSKTAFWFCSQKAATNGWPSFAVSENSTCFRGKTVRPDKGVTHSYLCENWGTGIQVDVFALIVHGNFNSWSIWSLCSTSGNGMQLRSRNCTNPAPLNGGRNCSGHAYETRPCPQWNAWSPCSTYCGLGYHNRTREPSDVQYKKCNNTECFVHSNWSDCTVSYGCTYTNTTRITNCTNPQTGEVCPYCIIENRKCNVTKKIFSWGTWGACSKTCGAGKKWRKRNCTFHITSFNDGSNVITYNTSMHSGYCLIRNCPVNGGFGPWRNSPCSVTCGLGTSTKTRSCDHPSPAHGGKPCVGETQVILECEKESCPVNGGYTLWTSWSQCSVSCGRGLHHRKRFCTNPPPKHGGICIGPEFQNISCSLPDCSLRGNFTAWSSWSTCTLTCGNGTQRRMRIYNDPHSANNGKNCTASISEKQKCNTQSCTTLQGNFSTWSNWSTCTLTCGGGIQRRMRTYNDPHSANSGKNCTEYISKEQKCNTQPCTTMIHGNYTTWGTWSICAVTCGGGTQQRMRTCTNPPPANGGRNCTGDKRETQLCNQQSCPTYLVNGRFTSWSSWLTCSLTCGNGVQQRMRTCTNPPPANGGANCAGPSSQTQDCNTQHCPINGKWTAWSDWSYCNRPCGTGNEMKTRTCTNPPPQYGGELCDGANNKSRTCNTNPCPAAEVAVVARFTSETWSNDLKDLSSAKSRALKEKIWNNVRALYEGDPSVTGIVIFSFRSGSVIANFSIQYQLMNSLQFVKLQDNMQTNGALSAMPLIVVNVSSTKVPTSSPTFIEAKNISSTSLHLKWSPVPSSDLHDLSLSGYVIFYRENSSQYTGNQLKSVRPQETSTTIDGLKKFTAYSLRIAASTANGNGLPSDPITVKTDEDVPSQSPPNFKVTAKTSTSISVSWDHIDPAYYHGIFQGYNLTLTNQTTGKRQTFIYNKNQLSSMFTSLNEYTKYRLMLCGLTSKGCGAVSELVVTTDEDKPKLAPPNTKVLDFVGTSSIKVSWDRLSEDDTNGVLRGYKLRLKLLRTSDKSKRDAEGRTIIIEPQKTSIWLENLKSFSQYEIQFTAFTTSGNGPWTTLVGETCRCPHRMPTNYWPHKPYVDSSTDGKPGGIFPHILPDLVTWVCDTCKNSYGKTVVDFSLDGRNQSSKKLGLIPMIDSLDQGTGLSFPVNGNKDLHNVYGEHPFVFLVQSPGIVFLTMNDPPGTTSKRLLSSLVSCGPLITLSFIIAYLAGIIMWFLDSRSPDGFPVQFTKGAYEGFWWAYITMTTVGYGDRSPKSVAARIFAIIWTLYGIVLAAMVTSSVTTSLTTVVVSSEKTIYGFRVAAVHKSSEHRIGILLNGVFDEDKEYHNLEEVLGALTRREVDGALVDTYVAECQKALFQNSEIQVTKKLERTFGYGIALGGDATRLVDEIRNYVMVNERKILNIIEANVETGTLSTNDGVSEQEAINIFDSSSELYQQTLMVLGSLLFAAVVCGLIWEAYHRRQISYQRKLKGFTDLDMHKQNTKLFIQDARRMVDHFCSNAVKTLIEVKQRHGKEKFMLLKRMKKNEEHLKRFKANFATHKLALEI